MKWWLLIVVGVAVVIAFLGRQASVGKKTPELSPTDGVVVRSVSLATDFAGAKVNQGDLIQGCLGGKDCIPAIDNPKFESAKDASKWLRAEDRVFGINVNGSQRAYPQRILNWHEIVNDAIPCALNSQCDQDPLYLIVTFCPLCGSALAFEPKVNGVITQFGVSGKLHNNDLVMYDRYEGSLWQQITGEAIVGPAARRNETLKLVTLTTTTWQEWKDKYTDTLVLSRDTGHVRNYDQYPYGTYEENEELLFGVKELNRALHIKAVVYGIEVNGQTKAYPEEVIRQKSVVNDTVGGVSIKVELLDSGEVRVTNAKTGEAVIPIRLFWFAWAAFHPDTELYTK